MKSMERLHQLPKIWSDLRNFLILSLVHMLTVAIYKLWISLCKIFGTLFSQPWRIMKKKKKGRGDFLGSKLKSEPKIEWDC